MTNRCRRLNAVTEGIGKQFPLLAVSVVVAAAGLGLVLGVVGKSRRHARQGQGKVTRCIDSVYNNSTHASHDQALSCLAEQPAHTSWAIQVYQPWSLASHKFPNRSPDCAPAERLLKVYGEELHSCPLPRSLLTPGYVVNTRDSDTGDDSTPSTPTAASEDGYDVPELCENVLIYCPPADTVALELPTAFRPCAGDTAANNLGFTAGWDVQKMPRLSREIIDLTSTITAGKPVQIPHSTLPSARSCSAVRDLTPLEGRTSGDVGWVKGLLQQHDGLLTTGDELLFEEAFLTQCTEAAQDELVAGDMRVSSNSFGGSDVAAVGEELLPLAAADLSFGNGLAEGLDWDLGGCDGGNSSSRGNSGNSSLREAQEGFDAVVTVTMGNPLFAKDCLRTGHRGVAGPSDGEDSAGEDPIRPPFGRARRRLLFTSIIFDNPCFSAPATEVFSPCFSSGSLRGALPAALPTSMMVGPELQPCMVASTFAVGAVLRHYRNSLAAGEDAHDSGGVLPATTLAKPLQPVLPTSPQPDAMDTLRENALLHQQQVQAGNASSGALTQHQPQEQGLEQHQRKQFQAHHLETETPLLESTREVKVLRSQDLVPPPETPAKQPPLAATIPASPTSPLRLSPSLLQATGEFLTSTEIADPSDSASSTASVVNRNLITPSEGTCAEVDAKEAPPRQPCPRHGPGAAHGRSCSYCSCQPQQHSVTLLPLSAVHGHQHPGSPTSSRPCASPPNTAMPIPKGLSGANSSSMWRPSASGAKSCLSAHVASATGPATPRQSATAAVARSTRCGAHGLQAAALGVPHLIKVLGSARSNVIQTPSSRSRPPFRPAAKCREGFIGLAHTDGTSEPALKVAVAPISVSPSCKLPKWALDLPSFMRPTQASLAATAMKGSGNAVNDSPAGMRTRAGSKEAGGGRRPERQDHPRDTRPRWR